MLRDKPTIESKLFKIFITLLKDLHLMHNAAFDMGFITRDIKKYLNIDLDLNVSILQNGS